MYWRCLRKREKWLSLWYSGYSSNSNSTSVMGKSISGCGGFHLSPPPHERQREAEKTKEKTEKARRRRRRERESEDTWDLRRSERCVSCCSKQKKKTKKNVSNNVVHWFMRVMLQHYADPYFLSLNSYISHPSPWPSHLHNVCSSTRRCNITTLEIRQRQN